MALKTITVENKSFDISYTIINPQAKYDLVILHGWGASKELMQNSFSPFMKDFRHIYVDLPGFGKSTNNYILDVNEYTKIVKKFLSVINVEIFAVAGHSFGGKVATLLNPKHLILLSSAGILESKSLKVKIKILIAKVLKSLGLGFISKIFRSKDVDSMSEVMYGTFKNAISENLEKDFKNYKGKAQLFWGEFDTATTMKAARKIDDLIEDSTLVVYKGDHYFFLKNAKDIGEKIVNRIL